MIKILVNRNEPTPEQIANRQDFSNVLASLPKKQIYTSPWFYGAVGLSSIGGILLIIACL